MAKLTDVFCTYTGGGVYVCTAKYGDVYLASDLDSYGTYDVPYDDIEEKYDCNYDEHWKDSSDPLPTWGELLESIIESHEAGISTNMVVSEVRADICACHPNLNTRIGDDVGKFNCMSKGKPDDIKTYPIGNGEITLTTQDAEELRILLQTEHLRRTINEHIDEQIDEFNFPTPRSRNSFVDELVRQNDDLISYDSIYYKETMMENIYDRANELKLLR